MPRYSITVRNNARAASEAADWTSEAATVAGSGYAAAGYPSVGAYLLFVGGALRLLGRAAQDVANDPPRGDFDKRTQLRAKRLRVEYLASEQPLEAAALELAVVAEESEAHLSAHLRAFERYQGRSGANAVTTRNPEPPKQSSLRAVRPRASARWPDAPQGLRSRFWRRKPLVRYAVCRAVLGRKTFLSRRSRSSTSAAFDFKS